MAKKRRHRPKPKPPRNTVIGGQTFTMCVLRAVTINGEDVLQIIPPDTDVCIKNDPQLNRFVIGFIHADGLAALADGRL